MGDDLKELAKRVAAVRAADKNKDPEQQPDDDQSKNDGYRAGAEMIINTVAGGLLGFGLDTLFNTLPLFLIIFFLTGFGWGLYKVYKITENMN